MEKKVLSVSKSSNSAPLVNLIAPEEEFKSQYHYQSPLYRITEDQDVEAFTEFKSGSILFLYVKSLFDFLRNIRDFNDNQEISFWLSNGLANLVLISSDKDALLDLASSLKEAEAEGSPRI